MVLNTQLNYLTMGIRGKEKNFENIAIRKSNKKWNWPERVWKETSGEEKEHDKVELRKMKQNMHRHPVQ